MSSEITNVTVEVVVRCICKDTGERVIRTPVRLSEWSDWLDRDRPLPAELREELESMAWLVAAKYRNLLEEVERGT